MEPAMLHSDAAAQHNLATCDYDGVPVTLVECQSGRQRRPVRLLVEGVFDLTHYGHARLLHQVRQMFQEPIYLIVGVSCDADCERLKRRPVLSNFERVELLRHLRNIDEIIPNCPFQLTPDWIRSKKIDFVCHDASPYTVQCLDQNGDQVDDLYGWLKDAGRFVATTRTVGISTSEIIQRVFDYSQNK